MKTLAVTSLAFLLLLPAIAAAQTPAPAAQPPAAQAPAPDAQPAATPGTGYTFVYGNDRSFASLLDKPFKDWPPISQKQFIRPTLENIEKLALFEAGPTGYRQLLKAVEDARMDKQTGSSAASEGTTSVVSKGLVSQVLALAVEEGALRSTDNKSIATFRGNALGIARLLTGREQFPFCAIYDFGCESPLARALGRLSFRVSLDTAPTSSAPAVATTPSANQGAVSSGSSQRVSGFGARYDFYVRKPLGKAFQQAFHDKLNTLAGADFSKAIDNWLKKLEADPRYAEWNDTTLTALRAVPAGDKVKMADIMNRAVTDLAAIARTDPDLQGNVDKLLTAMGDYFGRRDNALAAVVNQFSASLEYGDERPQDQPSQSSVKLILSYRPETPAALQLTFNSTATWYDHTPPQGAARRFRDAQAALQADRALTGPDARMGTALTIGYYFQYMADNALLTIPSGNLAPGTSIALPGDASVLLNTKGSIHIAQVGLTFSISGTGIKIPFTLSYSNRTELIKASDVRGHFGISYDLDSFFAGRAPKP